ncbi:hypothetical protein FQ085_11695 [Planococcus sp. ANT_H30]|uniref:hypothetical protein n=1 Tax=Planococcus sp. ANT_H30 TaxID=2597347 RepID=UPI0011EFE0C5|nr:hypothetical protein [Planococcus sp. ANT_H30]KAA0956650.1 hypothetical protein FQ085_11695 [Planococcus sp. ANT_H30]
MIYKEISLAAAMQMIINDVDNLYFENSTGLVSAKEIRFYFTQLKTYKWFKRIPKEEELPTE